MSHQPSRILLDRCQQAGCWWHGAQPLQECSLQYLCKNMGAASPDFQKCPLEGKTPLLLQESCRIWWGFYENNNKKILFSCAKIRRKAEQLLAAHKLPTTSQTCSSISSWSPLAPPAFALPLSTANKPGPGICQESLSLAISSPKVQAMLQTNHCHNGTEDRGGMADGGEGAGSRL